jgi:peptidoglycan hydrolase-like protein with peptidoglycan-binding domain
VLERTGSPPSQLFGVPNLLRAWAFPNTGRRASTNGTGESALAIGAPAGDPPTARELARAKRALERLGYRPGRMNTPRARAELATFQQAVGLANEPAGELTDRTLRKLEQTAKRVKGRDRGYLTRGMKGARVEKLQQRLKRLGDFEGAANGVYDGATADAVRTFRRRHPKLAQDTGSWSTRAQKSLRAELDNISHDPYRTRVKPSRERRLADAAALKEAREDGIGPGSPKSVISTFQKHLAAAGYHPNRSDGVWDDHTAAMARQFERRAGITHSGDPERFGEATWNRLSRSTMETNSNFSPTMKIGERSRAVLAEERRLEKAGVNPGKIDGIYTRQTERAADRIRRHFGIREDRDGIGKTTHDLIGKRIRELRSFQKPVDFRLTPGSEFLVPDAEGAPSSRGGRFHAAKDWFAPGGTRVRSPIAGKVVEVRPSTGNSGQVFGGTVKVQGKNGRVWVFRHVDPSNVFVGKRVNAGDPIARVTNWADGPDHTHVEVWKTLSGGYRLENMLDPMRFLKRFL